MQTGSDEEDDDDASRAVDIVTKNRSEKTQAPSKTAHQKRRDRHALVAWRTRNTDESGEEVYEQIVRLQAPQTFLDDGRDDPFSVLPTALPGDMVADLLRKRASYMSALSLLTIAQMICSCLRWYALCPMTWLGLSSRTK
jgi:hypothetical protein